MDDPASIKSQIEYGLDSVDVDRTVPVPLKDLLFVYQTIGEMIRFFHQPMHYRTLECVEQFLGDVDSNDAFAAMKRCYYDLLRDCWPADVVEMFDNGEFDNPSPPFYFTPYENGDD